MSCQTFNFFFIVTDDLNTLWILSVFHYLYGSPFSLIGLWGYLQHWCIVRVVACRWREFFQDFLHIILNSSRDKCSKLRNQMILLLMFVFFILRVQCYVLCSGLLLYSKFCCKILPAKYYDLSFEIYFCLDNDNSLLLESWDNVLQYYFFSCNLNKLSLFVKTMAK